MESITFTKINKDFYNFLNSNLDYDGKIILDIQNSNKHIFILADKIHSRKTLHLYFRRMASAYVSISCNYLRNCPHIENMIVGIESATAPLIDYSVYFNCKNLKVYGMDKTSLAILRSNLYARKIINNLELSIDDNKFSKVEITGLFDFLNLKHLKVDRTNIDNVGCFTRTTKINGLSVMVTR